MYFYSPSSVLIIFSPFIIFPSFFRFFCHAFIFFNHDHFFSPAYPTMSSSVGVSKSA